MPGGASTENKLEKIRTFMAITHTPEYIASEYMEKNVWELDLAVSEFFSKTDFSRTDFAKDLKIFFNYYARKSPLKLFADEILQLLNDIGIAPESKLALIFAWKCNAKQQHELLRKEFCHGMYSMGTYSLMALIDKLPLVERELERKTAFDDFFKFVFHYGKQPGEKLMDYHLACFYWKMLIGKRFKLLSEWCHFVEHIHKENISQDSWYLLLDFIEQTADDFKDYDSDAAWPTLMDEFVDYYKKKSTIGDC